VSICIKMSSLVIKISCWQVSQRMDERTDRQDQNITPSPANLAWQKNTVQLSSATSCQEKFGCFAHLASTRWTNCTNNTHYVAHAIHVTYSVSCCFQESQETIVLFHFLDQSFAETFPRSPKFGLRLKISQKVKSFFRLDSGHWLSILLRPYFGLSNR